MCVVCAHVCVLHDMYSYDDSGNTSICIINVCRTLKNHREGGCDLQLVSQLKLVSSAFA